MEDEFKKCLVVIPADAGIQDFDRLAGYRPWRRGRLKKRRYDKKYFYGTALGMTPVDSRLLFKILGSLFRRLFSFYS